MCSLLDTYDTTVRVLILQQLFYHSTEVSSGTQMNSQGVLGGVPSYVHVSSFGRVLGFVFRGAGHLRENDVAVLAIDSRQLVYYCCCWVIVGGATLEIVPTSGIVYLSFT